ncbi:HD domain-containing phosphohydrolase [Azonexus sp.]|uniref:HD domain-containing phosphohydrolase n=1 Tax=Azonexus sp. TaxID=1872668 RepID=UPI0027BAF437|nr:HD domain-containing phosphohydrolase [Azonexus sp.]
MPVKLNIRFQHWALGSTFLLVSLLSAAVLLTVFQTFRDMAETGASGRFSLIASQARSELDSIIQQSSRFVMAQAGAEAEQFVVAGRINQRDMVSTFVGSLEANPQIYSHFFGLANDEFLQVIAVRANPKVIAALEAPAETVFAVRRIVQGADGVRRESWQFLDARRAVLGQREQAARFVPTSRPWFAGATERQGLMVTTPYLFSSNDELGITVAAPLPAGAGVVASDISLASLQTFVEGLPISENGAIAVQDSAGQILAFHGHGGRYAGVKLAPLTPAERIDNPNLQPLRQTISDEASRIVELNSGTGLEKVVLTRMVSQAIGGTRFSVVVLAPLSDFLGAFAEAKSNVIQITLILLLFLIPLAYIGSRRVVLALTSLAKDSERLKHLDFSVKSQAPQTFLYEINALGEAQGVMQTAIEQRTGELAIAQEKLASLVEYGISLSREQDRTALLKHILVGAKHIAHCAAATLFLKTERDTLAFAHRTHDDELPAFEIPLYQADGSENDKYVVCHAALRNETVVIDDVYAETRFDLSGTKRFSEESGFRTISLLTVPLSPREGEVIGLIQLLNAQDPHTGEIIPFPPDILGFIEALAAQSAIALENQNLLEAQKVLMDALIKLVAGAIDAKSAYTGGHCERVPELAMMLLREADAQDHGPLADFNFSTEDEWREFRIGAWLHDCGKVTTPEYVVDKATKLETIYNRIHEVRMRFEVLLRDAEIDRLRAIHERGEAHAAADARFAERKAHLLDDFAFLAESNMGGEFMAPERIARVRRIAEETWLRHFDDRLGLSQDELRRRSGELEETLPVQENLLTDKPWHVVAREGSSQAYASENGWKVSVPKDLYNFGEVYNLIIAKGTLTEEERFKINEHIIQSILMLERLPLPKQLRRVPEYAGTHHETMIGTGYPRKLRAEDLSIPSRIMAIADIFEALTASDRPYKPMKTLSESIKILSFFKKDRHIDPVLFDLFLTSGVYREYAARYLKPEQIDEVDISQFIG